MSAHALTEIRQALALIKSRAVTEVVVRVDGLKVTIEKEQGHEAVRPGQKIQA